MEERQADYKNRLRHQNELHIQEEDKWKSSRQICAYQTELRHALKGGR
jgi:hypothetical protein